MYCEGGMVGDQLYLMLISLGFILVTIGIIVILAGSLKKGESGEEGETEVEAGGVVIIGPIPIVFGSSQRITVLVLVLAIVLTILTLSLYIISVSR